MGTHIHLHDARRKGRDNRTTDYGTSEGARKAAATRSRGGTGRSTPGRFSGYSGSAQRGKAPTPKKPMEAYRGYGDSIGTHDWFRDGFSPPKG